METLGFGKAFTDGSIELKGRSDRTGYVLDHELADKAASTCSSSSFSGLGPSVFDGSARDLNKFIVQSNSGGTIFGAYVGDGLRRGSNYYGNGESFLWKYQTGTGQFSVFKWTGRNDYFALCQDDYLSFGGGDGAYGLYIDESLLNGSSARCPTFDNPPLCSSVGIAPGKTARFDCAGLEIWGIGP
ncbi:oxidation resistance protein 1 [Marasmius tenuissimus]|nr:oxidation resistance protein 1 [Marasmius tenuissimus]